MASTLSSSIPVAGTEYLSTLSLEDRRQNGQVYTPPHLVEFVLRQAGYDAQRSTPLLDPACGAGAFLEGAVAAMAASTIGQGQPRSAFLARVEAELFGVDIDKHACALALAAVRRSVKEASPGALRRDFFESNIVHGDFLAESTIAVLLERVRDGFALIVGNPPYVSATRIAPKTKARLRERFATAAGRLDLYTLFMERAVRLATTRGRVALITPDKFLVTQSARTLRAFLVESTAIRSIARFRSHKVFAGAAMVPCVTVFERDGHRSPVEVLTCAEESAAGAPRVEVLEQASVAHAAFTSAPWYLSTSDDLALAREIQGKHPRLAQFTVRVSAGPATGRDGVFVFPRGSQAEIERELLRPAVRGRDVEAYAVKDPGLEILVPYVYDRAGNARLIDLARFPGAARYLARHRAELRERHCVRVWEKSWFDLHDQPTVDLAGLTKILVPDVANSNRFAVDPGGFFPLHSAYYMVPRAGVDPFYLVGILNSRIAAFFVRVFSPVVKDGFNRYRQQFLSEIPIPLAGESEQRAIAAAARAQDGARVDELVARLFRLSDDAARRIREVLEAAES